MDKPFIKELRAELLAAERAQLEPLEPPQVQLRLVEHRVRPVRSSHVARVYRRRLLSLSV